MEVPFLIALRAFDPDTRQEVGPLLWSSSGQIPTGSALPAPLTFDVGVGVDPGSVYLMAVKVNGVGDGSLWIQSDNRYADGRIYERISDTGPYATLNPSWDVAFRAEFEPVATVVPEPITMLLLGTGLAGVGAARRRRRRPQPEAA
jgi:hypothetical protein